MEIRRVQLTGGSSYVVTLPKDWIDRMNVKKNDPLGIIVQQDGTLLITTSMTDEHSHREKTFQAEDVNGKEEMMRLLIGAYITGHTMITIVGKGRIDPEIRETAVKFTRTAIGPEVIDEDQTRIVLKDLLNPVQMPFEKTLRRMYVLARSMQEDALQSLEEGRLDLAESVVERDRELDRLHWLVSRQMNMVMADPSLSRKMGATHADALHSFLLSRIVERIGDHAVRMAGNSKELSEVKVGPKVIREISTAGKDATSLFNKSIESWFKGDLKGANANITESRHVVRNCEAVMHGAINIKGLGAVAAGNMVESVRRIAFLAADINELLINNIVRLENEKHG